jgi:adenylosuccinate synthase
MTVLGAQWGDEGKGKLVDVLAKHYDIVARFNGGANAGHTLKVDGRKFAFHLLPCGMLYPNKLNVIGNGVVLHVPTLFKELASLDDAGIDYADRLKISDRAHMLFDFHQTIDGLQEAGRGGKNIGTTKKGIGPCYSSKTTRNGIRVGELLDFDTFRKERYPALLSTLQDQYGFEHDAEAELEQLAAVIDRLRPMITDTVHLVNSAHQSGSRILAEGANAALLDLDFGTYPFVTSSSTTAGGISTGLGIAPSKIETAIGVVKAYTTRVGSGPFPTELEDDVGQALRDNGQEYGTTTGRPRRCGWLDLPVVHYSHMVNNYSSLNITKLDVLSGLDEVRIGTHYKLRDQELPTGMMPSLLEDLAQVEVVYESMPGWKEDISLARTMDDLPPQAVNYLKRIEELTNVPVSWVGVGAGREDMATNGFDLQ